MIEVLGLVAAFMTTASFLPQAIKTIKTRDVSGISLLMYVMLFAGCILWATYGFIQHLRPVWIANVITGCFVLIILVIKIGDLKEK